MADEINKKISIGVEVNTDGQQQIAQYKTALDNLRISVANLSDPFSGLSGSISNLDKDMQKLTGSIDKMNKQNQDLSSGGNKVKSTVLEVISTFGGLSKIMEVAKGATAAFEAELTAGLSILIAFIPEIIDWVGALFKGNTTLSALNKTLKDNKIVMDAVNQARAQGKDDAQQELVHLKLLYRASQDHNLSLKERKKVISELQSRYPDYFGNMSTDAILAGKAAKSYNELTKAIIATARAKAAEDIIVKNQVRQLGNEDKLQKLKTDLAGYKKELAAAQLEYNKYTSHPAIGGGTVSTGDTEEAQLYQTLAGIKDKAKEAELAISHLNTDSTLLNRQNEALAKTAIGDTEKYGTRVLGIAQNKTEQLIKTSSNGLKKLHKLNKEAEKINSPQSPQAQPTSNTDDLPRLEEPIDPGTTPGAGTDHALTQQPAGGFKTDMEDKKVKIKKTALQQAEELAKKSEEKIADFALSTLTNSIKQKSDAKIAALEKDKAAELSNNSLTSAQKLAIENKYKKQEAAVKVKAFKDEQKASIAQAIINGAIAITKAEAQTGVLGPLVIPGIIAETAVQVAKVASQKPPAYAKGGMHYSSDGLGGVLPGYSRTDNTNAYLRSGEGIVVSEAMQVPWARNLVSAINVGFGGRDFSMTNPGRGYAVGGIFTDGGDANRYYNQPVTDQKNLANTIAYQMINNFPPVYVDVKDVNSQQNILAQTINRVNL